MTDTKRLEHSAKLALSIPKNAKKGAVLVRCSSLPMLAYEYLVRFVGEQAIFGAKRVVDINFNAPSELSLIHI